MMTDDEISGLAKQLIAEVTAQLQGSITTVEQNGEIVLIASVGDSVLNFHPQLFAERVIREQVSIARFREDHRKDFGAREYYIHQQSRAKIGHMFIAVSTLLGDALWMLEQISGVFASNGNLRKLYPDLQKRSKLLTLGAIEGRLREIIKLPDNLDDRLEQFQGEMTSPGPSEALNEAHVVRALRQLQKFSIQGLAQTLAPGRDIRSTVRGWLTRRDMSNDELEALWQRVRAWSDEEFNAYWNDIHDSRK